MKSSTSRVEIKVLRLSHGMGLPLPSYQTDEASGLDLMAAVPLTAPLRLLPGLVLHEPDGRFTPAADAILRDAAALCLDH